MSQKSTMLTRSKGQSVTSSSYYRRQLQDKLLSVFGRRNPIHEPARSICRSSFHVPPHLVFSELFFLISKMFEYHHHIPLNKETILPSHSIGPSLSDSPRHKMPTHLYQGLNTKDHHHSKYILYCVYSYTEMETCKLKYQRGLLLFCMSH